MNKVKITVLKTEFYEDLAREYGREELGPCTAMQVGKVYYADVKCPAGFCNTCGTAFTSMFSRWQTAQARMDFSITTGQGSQAWLLPAVMTASVRWFSNLKQQISLR